MREALSAQRRRLSRLYVRGGAPTSESAEIEGLARARGIPVEAVDPRELERVCGPELRAQGVALQAGPIPEASLEALLERGARSARLEAMESGAGVGEPAAAGRGRRIVVLDGVEDPQNVGAIARVAEAAGCLGLVLADRRAPPLSAAVSRASAGAIEWLPVARVTNLVRALEAA